MSLLETTQPHSGCSGTAHGFGTLSEVVDKIEEFLRVRLPQIITDIQGWNGNKRQSERAMTEDLALLLPFEAEPQPFQFLHENTEPGKGNRSVDLGVFPLQRIYVAPRTLGAKDRLYVLEAKRLPTAVTSLEKQEREREYVVGDWHRRQEKKKPLSGGIERFKECEHGRKLQRAGMLAFVQKGDTAHWLGQANGWIDDLTATPPPRHQATWAKTDHLALLPPASPHAMESSPPVTELESTHARSDGTTIRLRHFWLDLRAQPAKAQADARSTANVIPSEVAEPFFIHDDMVMDVPSFDLIPGDISR
ncbi:MAG: hypothetical protein ACO1TE_18610 [Prosthecobacter sp.]